MARTKKDSPLFNPELAAKKIGIPLEEWPGNCYGIATAFVKAGLIRNARAVYGHYYGPVHRQSMFWVPYSKAGWCRHGWIFAKSEGSIVDPTRWVFENVAPYIHVGRDSDEYDEGGSRLRAALLRPPPAYDEMLPKNVEPRPITLKMSKAAMDHVRSLFQGLIRKDGVMSQSQTFWLANLPVQMLKPHAASIMKALVKAKLSATIPIDNYRAVLGEDFE